MALDPKITLQAFDKWDVNFVGPINPPGIQKCARYIITMTYYSTRWDEATPVKYCIVATDAKFLFDRVVTRFGFPKILVSDQGTQFVNKMIEK